MEIKLLLCQIYLKQMEYISSSYIWFPQIIINYFLTQVHTKQLTTDFCEAYQTKYLITFSFPSSRFWKKTTFILPFKFPCGLTAYFLCSTRLAVWLWTQLHLNWTSNYRSNLKHWMASSQIGKNYSIYDRGKPKSFRKVGKLQNQSLGL